MPDYDVNALFKLLEKNMHYARTVPFQKLYDDLEKEVHDGWVRRVKKGNLALYCYTEQTVYERNWNNTTKAARGLILDVVNKKVIATPFPKFFNYQETDQAGIPNEPYIAYEKLDGSLIIAYHYEGEWHCATKGSFYSDQAKWATEHLRSKNTQCLWPGNTYLFEGIYPENRIVIRYDFSGLVLLGAYNENGREYSHKDLELLQQHLRVERVAYVEEHDSITELLKIAMTLPAEFEGWVLKFESGYRLKIKGEEYRRIHATISRITPLAIWEHLLNGDDTQKIRVEIPEEFGVDFDNIAQILVAKHIQLLDKVQQLAYNTMHLSDKELGLALKTLPSPENQFVFGFRKHGVDSPKLQKGLWKLIRPTANKLEGYTPSSAMNRIMENE